MRKSTRKRIQTDRKVNGVNTRMTMATITPQIEIKTKLIYSFKSKVHCAAAKIVDYSKKLTSPPGIFSNAEEFQAYIKECVQKLLDLENAGVFSKPYLPATRATETQGNYQFKVTVQHIQIRLVASNELLMGCGQPQN